MAKPKKKTARGARGTRPARESGPAKWLFPQLEATYARLVPREQAEADYAAARPKKAKRKGGAKAYASQYQEDQGEEVLQPCPSDFWAQRLAEYKRRKVGTGRPPSGSNGPVALAAAIAAPMPAVPGANNWVPLGPSVVARGQAGGRPAVSGRISGLAIANGGARIYAATAVGGVWRSDDTGRSWRSLMDGFDQDPTSFASTSLAIGAIAIDLADPDRIYCGTGEGATNALFAFRLTNALPSYRGIGPIRSDDGGSTWVVEPTAAASPTLAGKAFFGLAADPGDRENVVAATTDGLYQRIPAGAAHEWVQRRTGIHSSVVVARTGATTTFYAAAWGDRVYASNDGNTWTVAGTGFPTANVGRISLAVQRDNPNVLYALVANNGGTLHGVYRLDGGAGAWKTVAGVPDVVSNGQGSYDLAIAIDPMNANRIYVGGDTQFAGGNWSSTINRCDVSPSGAAYAAAATYLGTNVHADTHVLALPPGDSNTLWAGGDGGAFVNTNPTAAGTFEARNTGLASLCTNYIGQSATEPAVIFCGLQDNGTARYVGEEVWRHVQAGDGGYCVVHWVDPFKVLVYANGTVYRATDGGQDYASWSPSPFRWLIMAEPLVGTPPNPAAPAEADIVALGVGGNVQISTNFGSSWPTTVALPAGSGSIYSMVFANATRIFVGTTTGRVFRLDNVAGTWTATRIDNVAAGPLGLVGMVADIAVDWSDASRSSIYIAFGGSGDYRHVWRFDGASWQARSGPAAGPNNLLDVEHNCILVDPDNTSHVYVGADIGVWRSTDSGNNWLPLSTGLPDAPVFDLQIQRQARLLRASTHGRGLFEWKLDPPNQPDVDLYVRDTTLDTGRGENTDFRNDPTQWPTQPVVHWLSSNVKVDVPTPAGYQTPTNQIDFFQFNEVIVDGSNGVGTNVPPPPVVNRVYVEVHNRGRVDAGSVQVMAAVTNASTVLNLLPIGYEANVVAGTNLPGPDWTTLGVRTLTNLRAGTPQIAAFDLPSTILPMPASLPGQSHFCLVAFVHSAQDGYTSTQRNVDLLTLSERKVAQKNLHIVEFVGTPPPPGTGLGMWAMIDVAGTHFKQRGRIDLVLDARRFPGRIGYAWPVKLLAKNWREQVKDFRVQSNKPVKAWADRHVETARRLFWEAKYSERSYKKLITAMEAVREQPFLVAGTQRVSTLPGIVVGLEDRHTIFLRIDPPKGAKVGSRWEFSLVQRDAETGRVQGGSTYRVVVNRPVKKS
jgi:hypothetical protein